ncbi:MAG: hypothetical protein LBF74_06140 [Treponema sp.]|jgi:hypothetical protein|nr:hypothetical protein [Treponema sp.]
MSINSVPSIEEKREEAIKLFISSVQKPISAFDQADDAANQIVKGAEILLAYVLSGEIKEPSIAKRN